MTKTSIYHLNSGLCPFDKRFWSRMPILLERQMKYLTSEYIEIWICSVDRERGFAKQEGYTAFIDSQGKLCKESFGIEEGNRADISASAKCHFHSAKGLATNAKPMKRVRGYFSGRVGSEGRESQNDPLGERSDAVDTPLLILTLG